MTGVQTCALPIWIKKGETFTEVNLITKRPGNGINPMRWDELIGKKSKKDYCQDDLINTDELEKLDEK